MQTDSQQLTVRVVDAELVLVHGPGGWRCLAEPPAGACDAVYQRAAEAALAGAGLAVALNALIVDPAHAQIVASHMDAMLAGDACDETVQGAMPVAFEAARVLRAQPDDDRPERPLGRPRR